MKILWLTNVVLRDACIKANLPISNGGGWMQALLEDVVRNRDVQFAIATVYGGDEMLNFQVNEVEYYLLPLNRSNKKYRAELEPLWTDIITKFKPDIVHIWGTEYSHGLAAMNACPNMKYLLDIQGLCSVIERYYFAGITISSIVRNLTIRDLLKRDTILNGKIEFKRRGIIELEYIRKAKNIVGRTTWDYIYSKVINPNIEYHFCNHSLRSAFYDIQWEINTIQRHRIFLSQSIYPLKGLHMVLKAISLLKNEYKDIEVYVAGNDITKSNTIYEKVKLTGYGKYIKSLIRKYSLQKNIIFTGILDSRQMADQFKSAHAFICPSSIEDSPNSLGEAQLVGTPSIASYVGGIPEIITHNESGLLYRFEAYEILADSISRIFNDDELAKRFSMNGRRNALKRHNRVANSDRIIEIYKSVHDG